MIKHDKYYGPERRSPERKQLTNQFTIQLMRQVYAEGTVILINEPVKFKGHPTFNYVD